MKEYNVHYETLSDPVKCIIQYTTLHNDRFYLRVIYQEQVLYISTVTSIMFSHGIQHELDFKMNGVYLYCTVYEKEYKHKYTIHSEIEVVDIFI